jgi:hypothetical protein
MYIVKFCEGSPPPVYVSEYFLVLLFVFFLVGTSGEENPPGDFLFRSTEKQRAQLSGRSYATGKDAECC